VNLFIRNSLTALALSSSIVAGVVLAQSARKVVVTEVVVATSVEDHEPVGTATSFSSGTPLMCFIRAQNRTGADATIRVTWEAGEGAAQRARGGVSLTVPARPTFRTYARSASTRAAGSYRCVVRAEDGEVLGSAAFTISG